MQIAVVNAKFALNANILSGGPEESRFLLRRLFSEVMDQAKAKAKPRMTEEERAALAKKLDDDLEHFMEEMAAKKVFKLYMLLNRQRKSLSIFDEWCRDIDQHPAFMKDLDAGLSGQYADTLSALQDDMEDKQLSAERHKEEGNKHFKFKKYRWATDCYSEGNVTDVEKKQLDALEQVKEKAVNAVLVEERNKRKARAEEKKDLEEKRRLLKALSDRKLNFRPRLPFSRPELMDWSLLEAAEQTEKKPFDFDEWCRDIDQHPAFMKDLDAGLNGQYADTLSALQALKYDEDDMEDKQLSAERHKEEGNKHFKFKKYRWATDCYSEGIKVQCMDLKLNSVLYGNRAAAQKHIGNRRSAIKDCAMALKFDPRNLKAANRGAECLLELGYAQQCVDWIERAKKTFAFTKETEEEGNVTDVEKKQLDALEQVKEKAVNAVLVEERNKRKARAEAGQVDILTDCDETAQIGSVLRPMFETPAEWDKDHKFRLENIRMFVSDEWNEYVHGSLGMVNIYTRDEIEKKLSDMGENKFVIN
ncbi:tetratricopeptide repeat protein [Ostertagia ostertagi]